MFRRFKEEIQRDPDLWHVLDCGHEVESKVRQSDALPVVRRWCAECWEDGRPPRISGPVALELDEDAARWLAGVMSAGIVREDWEHPDIARRVIAALKRTYRSNAGER